MSSILKAYWLLTISFKSALHIGKGSSDSYMGAAEITQNGAGKYVIPGTSLAGVFFNTLKNCMTPEDRWITLWKELTGDSKTPTDHYSASWLIFRSAEIEPNCLMVRDKVSINRTTKTAKEGAKFSTWEVNPKDLDILIEFDNMTRADELDEEASFQILKWVGVVLSTWLREGFFLGANSGTGSGHVIVKAIKKCNLDETNFQTYLDASYADLPSADMGWNDFTPDNSSIPRSAFRKKLALKVKVGYQNPLLIKGGVGYISHTNPETDAPFIHKNGEPYIPGSSIRGAISSFMDKYSWTDWMILLGQPKDERTIPTTGGFIIFTDLKMKGTAEPVLKKIERHAEDQFSRAIFGSGKFDEERLFNAEFQGEVFVLNSAPLQDIVLQKMFDFLRSGLQNDMISIGSGACYPKITLEEMS